MATKRRYAIIRFSNWYDGEANAKVHMDFYGERNAVSEWQVFVTDEQSQDEALYLLMDIHEGEVLASYNSKVKA